jgi:hypothetical protein
MKYFIPVILAISLSSCGKRNYLSLMQDRIDARYLASTHVGTPDPRQAHPPYGQRIVINWFLPNGLVKKNLHINLHVLYWNNTTAVMTYPVNSQRGSQVYFLLNDDFDAKKGILTYKAELVSESGEVCGEWKHQLWVNLINIEPDMPQPTFETPDSRLEPIEEIYEEEEMSDDFFYPPPDQMEREDLPPVEGGEISPQQHEMDEQS